MSLSPFSPRKLPTGPRASTRSGLGSFIGRGRKQPRRRGGLPLASEALESRQLLAVTATQIGNDLNITVDDNTPQDTAFLRLTAGGDLEVSGDAFATLIGTFPQASVNQIKVSGSTGVEGFVLGASAGGIAPSLDMTGVETIEFLSGSNFLNSIDISLDSGDIAIADIATSGALSVTTPGKIAQSGVLAYSTLFLNAVDSVEYVVSTQNDAGAGSLRAALIYLQDNAATVSSRVSFQSSVSTISPLTGLPDIQKMVTIDGGNGVNLVRLDGSAAGAVDGLTFKPGSEDSVVLSLVVTNFDQAGIRVEASRVSVESSFIGLTQADVAAANRFGILVSGPAVSACAIGTGSAGNVISGNTESGIRIDNGASATVRGNIIGLNASGSAVVANGGDGVLVSGAGAVVLGGTNTGDGNTISGNGGNGVFDTGAISVLRVAGNLIGTDISGVVDLGNALSGIVISDNAQAVITGNLVSGNGRHGIEIALGSSGNVIQDNVIGLDTSKLVAIGNGLSGIAITGGSTLNTVGGSGLGNLVAGNGEYGIHLHAASSGTTVTANTIGLKGDGSTGAGNALAGIFIDSSADNLITGNTISANFGDGIHVIGLTAIGNEIRANLVGTSSSGALGRGNFGAGIRVEGVSGITIGGSSALDANTVSANASDGIVISADPTGGSKNAIIRGNRVGTDISGSAALANRGVGIRIDGVGSDNALVAGNLVSGNTGDGIFVGNGANKAQIVSNLVGVNSAATAAVANGGDGISIVGGANHVVGGAADGNVVSGNAGRGISIEAGATGVLVAANLVGTNGLGTAAVGNGSDGISIDESAGVQVAGNVASGNGGSGIAVSGATSIGTLIVGNRLGTNAAGLAALPNSQQGVAVTDAVDTVIGGTAAGAANVISGNTGSGVLLVNADGTAIQANAVGFNAPRLAGLGNGGDGITVIASDSTTIDAGNLIAFNGQGSTVAGHGIRISQSSSTVVGSPTTGQRGGNTIYRNQLDGIRIEAGSIDTVVAGNFVGTTSAGRVGLGNRGAGIAIVASTGTTVGGRLGSRSTDPVLGNLVIGNAEGVKIVDSVALVPADANTVLGNVIRSNRSTGIALSGSSGQVIGGVAATDANVIVLNGADGISVSNTLAGGGAGNGGNLIAGNAVGTDLVGTGKLGNTGDGIVIRDSVGNVVGGAIGSGNTVTASRNGIRLINAVAADLAAGNVVTANIVRANLADGIRLEGSDFNKIGVLSPSGNADVSGGNAVWQNVGDGIAVVGKSRQNLVVGNLVGVSATNAPLANGRNGITIAAGIGNTVAANVAGANRGRGIAVSGGSGNTIGGTLAGLGNIVQANLAGGVSLADGTTNNRVVGNQIDRNAGAGISLTAASGNQIDAGNVITRNATAGISLTANSNGNTISQNSIGTDATGLLRLGNLGPGIRVAQSFGNIVGGTGAANTVLFNAGNGVEIVNSTASTALLADSVVANRVASNAAAGIAVTGSRFVAIAANDVGGALAGQGNGGSGISLGLKTDLATVMGNNVLGNGRHGIELVSATRSMIGDTGAGLGNVVGLNRDDGINLSGGATGNTIVGNSVGIDGVTLAPLANGGDGIEVAASISNVVRGNLVASNKARGIAISNAAAASLLVGNTVAGNTVRNNASGIVLAGSSGTTVGGTTVVGGVNVDANLVSSNTADGIAVTAQSKTSAIIANVVESNGADGIRIASSTGSNVRLNEVRSNGSAGIRLATASGSAAASGNQLLSNVISANRGSGILLNGSSFNAIGGINAGNTIFSNAIDGITLEAASNSNDVVQNVIGIDTVNASAANGRDGVRVTGSFSTTIRDGNQIANNIGSGVRIVAAAAQAAAQGIRVTGNTLQANLAGGVVVDGGGAHMIGGNAAGMGNAISANGVAGVVLQMAPGTSKLPGVTVGRNTISANAGPGVLVSGGSGHTVSTNQIVGNSGDGVSIGLSVSNVIVGNTIGGLAPADANVNGINLADGSVSNLLSGNTIAGNAADGVRITGIRSTDNIIGARVAGNPATGVANVVSENAGVAVRVQQGVRNQVGTNSFFGNISGGVVLQNGGNSGQAAPVLTAATRIVTAGLVQLRLTGTLSGAPRQVMVVEFFSNDPSDGSTVTRAGYQARTSIGRATITLDASGKASFTTTLNANVAVGQYITAIATTASGTIGNSSQISALAMQVTAAAGSPGTPSPPSSQPRAGAFTRW